MTNKEKVSMSWSGGKDCSLALFYILEKGNYEVVSLHTTIDFNSKKVGLHGVPEALIEKQAHLLNIPLEKIYLNKPDSALSYEEVMLDYYDSLKKKSINKIISGDIFLEDLRAYKEELALKKEIKIELPLWGYATSLLVEDFINLGFKTIICAADAEIFTSDVVGKTIDLDFVKQLPKGVDPCGENGEFHTFTYGGPIFKKEIDYVNKDVITESYKFKTKDGDELERKFYYVDLEKRI